MRLSPGRTLDRYVVELHLGSGGMAEVWQVRHALLGTRHALKIPRKEDARLNERLLREGRAQAALHHPNLLPVRDIIDVDGSPGLLLPLVEGPSLDQLLEVHGLSQAEALSLFAGVVAGVAHAHAHGFIHRDLKPGNVLLTLDTGRMVPRVTDFGLVKRARTAGDTETGLGFGTLPYAAPEQLVDASTVDARSDIFSLGVLLIELLTGERHHPSGPHAEAEFARLTAGWPPGLRELAQHLIERDPDKRLPTTAELSVRAQALIEDLPEYALGPEATATMVAQDLARARSAQAPEGEEDTDGSTIYSPGAAATTMWPMGTWGSDRRRRPAPGPPHNLPASRDPFIGRSRELAQVLECIDGGGRLITITGAPGTGKSRLALELARQRLPELQGGAWLCDVADAHSLVGLYNALSTALSLPLGTDPQRQVGDALVGFGPALFILDNFTHVAELGAGTVGRWLDQAPDAVFIVSSAVPLRLRGEQVVALPPLDPVDAVELFLTRARSVDSSFDVDADGREEVGRLVELLDCLPLAIELAAARTRMLTVERILERLGERFDLLRSRGHDRPDRQQTLRSAIAWSWRTLEPWEQGALAQASVFENGFDFPAAMALIDLSPWPEAPWVEDVLAELVDKSVLQARQLGSEGPRFRILLSIQAYAREQLPEPGPVLLRHATWYARFGTPEALEALHRHGGAAHRRALTREIDNLWKGASVALERGEASLALGCARAAAEVLRDHGPLGPVVDLLSRVRAVQPEGERSHVHLLEDEAHLLAMVGRGDEALARLEQAVSLARLAGADGLLARSLAAWGGMLGRLQAAHLALEPLGEALTLLRGRQDRRGRALVLGHMSAAIWRTEHDLESLRYANVALELAREVGDVDTEATVLDHRAIIRWRSGRTEEAILDGREAMRLSRELGHRGRLATHLRRLAVFLADRGDFEEAQVLFGEALDEARRLGQRRDEAIVLNAQGMSHVGEGRYSEARECLVEAVAIGIESGEERVVATSEGGLGEIQRRRGQAGRALPLLQKALSNAMQLRSVHAEAEWRGMLALALAAEGRHVDARAHLDLALELVEGRHLERSRAKTLTRRVLALAPTKDPVLTGQLEEAEALADHLGARPGSDLRRLLREAREALGLA